MDTAGSGVNMTAYATKDDAGVFWLTVINKDFSTDASVKTVVPSGCSKAECFRLEAPTMESTNQVTFAGSKVSDDGGWSAGQVENFALRDGAITLSVPHASAAIICFKP